MHKQYIYKRNIYYLLQVKSIIPVLHVLAAHSSSF